MKVIVSKDNKAVLVPYDKVGTLWPDAPPLRVNGTCYTVLPHTPQMQIRLGKLGIKVPPPILFHYDWKSADGAEPFQIQKNTAAMLTSQQRAYVCNDLGCVDADTEYLSPSGWQRIADYKDGLVAQYHPKDGSITFVQPDKFVKLPCAEMIRFKTGRGVDQLLSPEHRVLLTDGSVISAEEVESIYYSPKGRGRLRFPSTFHVTGTEGIALSDAEIRLQVAVNADGYQPSSWHGVTVIEVIKTRKVNRLRGLLAEAGHLYREKVYGKRHIFSFRTIWPKGFGSNWWQATQAQLEIIADELHHWDGHVQPGGLKIFYTAQRADADFAQYAYSAAGLSASLRRRNQAGTHWRVYASQRTSVGLFGGYTELSNISREIPSDGYKYCFMVPSTFLIFRRNGCVFASGNTGKTRSSLYAWRYLYEAGAAKKLLVIAPLSTLKFVWLAEIFRMMPNYKATVLHGTKAKRLELLNQDSQIFVINHDGLKTIAEELHVRQDIDCLILDELAVYRNNSQRSKLMRQFAQRFTWVWGMSGRPMPTLPTDVWAQCKIITPHTVPKYFRHARTMLMTQVDQFKWLPKRDAIETAFSWMQPSVRYSLDDVVELPQAVYRTNRVDLSDEQAKVYRKLSNEFAVMIREQRITAANAAVALGKLLQVGCGFVYTTNPQYVTLDSEPRQQALLRIVEEAPDKLIVFAPWRHLIDNLSTLLAKNEIDHAVVHGDISHREKIFNAFQNTSQYTVLLAHPACVHHGLTLTAATTTVWYSPITSLEVYDQACARIRRIGQTKRQLFLHLTASPVETKVYAMLHQKQKTQDQFLAMLKTALNGEHNDERQWKPAGRQQD